MNSLDNISATWSPCLKTSSNGELTTSRGNQLHPQASHQPRLSPSSWDKDVSEGQDNDIPGGIPGCDATLTAKLTVKLEVNRRLHLSGLAGWQSPCKAHLNPNFTKLLDTGNLWNNFFAARFQGGRQLSLSFPGFPPAPSLARNSYCSLVPSGCFFFSLWFGTIFFYKCMSPGYNGLRCHLWTIRWTYDISFLKKFRNRERLFPMVWKCIPTVSICLSPTRRRWLTLETSCDWLCWACEALSSLLTLWHVGIPRPGTEPTTHATVATCFWPAAVVMLDPYPMVPQGNFLPWLFSPAGSLPHFSLWLYMLRGLSPCRFSGLVSPLSCLSLSLESTFSGPFTIYDLDASQPPRICPYTLNTVT